MISRRFILIVATGFSLPALVQSQSPVWGQCGGIGWQGSTTCVSGSACTYVNDWYSQCIPGAASSTVVTTPSSTAASSTSASTPSSTAALRLRVLPLGDSITFGLQSSSGNGYRSTLHTLLEQNGTNSVDFIGSVKAGTMADNDNEGHSGFTIDQIASTSKFAQALPSKPNVVFLMAGTNDVFGGSISTAPTRLANLIDSIFTSNPDTTLIVATLTPLPSGQSQVNTYNSAVVNLVNTRASAGKHIVLADMKAVLSSDLADGVHPNDAGYVKMANAYYASFLQAVSQGWIGLPL